MIEAMALGEADLESSGARIAWHFDPWREHPRLAMSATLAAGGLCLLTLLLRESIVLGLGLAVFCLAAFAPAMMPRDCAIDADGVESSGLLGTTRRRWVDIHRIDDLPAGLLLSPHARPTPLDAARALLLPMPLARRTELRATARACWQASRA